MNAIRYTVFVGELVQDSAFHTGGRLAAEGNDLVKAPLARDGKGRFIYPGRGAKGAMLGTARKLYPDLDIGFLGGEPAPERGEEDPLESSWRVANLHPAQPLIREYRQGVGILHSTGAAAEKRLFDIETLACGTRWGFRLRVDHRLGRGRESEGIAAAVLLEWMAGRCFLGSNVARGLGWMHLERERTRAYRLDVSHAHLWPNSFKGWQRGLAEDLAGLPAIAPLDFATSFAIPPVEDPWHYCVFDCRMRLGERRPVRTSGDDTWGFDALAVGGHEHDRMELLRDPESVRAKTLASAGDFDPDAAIAMARRLEPGKEDSPQRIPYIPGSGLRGPLHHALARQLNREHLSAQEFLPYVRDPNRDYSAAELEGFEETALDPVFGTPDGSARLLVRDAYLIGQDWRGVLLQQHAEDEVLASTYDSHLYNRLMLIEGEFAWRMILEAPDRKRLQRLRDTLEPVLEMACQGRLAIGGKKWSGAGWVPWEIQVLEDRAGSWSAQTVPEGDAKAQDATATSSPDKLAYRYELKKGLGVRQYLADLGRALASKKREVPDFCWLEPRRGPRRDQEGIAGACRGLPQDASGPPLERAYVYWSDRALRVIARGSGVECFEYGQFKRGAQQKLEVERRCRLVYPRRDWRRYGLQAPSWLPERLEAIEYWHRGQLLEARYTLPSAHRKQLNRADKERRPGPVRHDDADAPAPTPGTDLNYVARLLQKAREAAHAES
jgi:CRISPR/Cas system CSM-associated protein Csm3 (group 7 of RAMP superfamily)